MKKKLYVLILILVIGFASVTTTLIIRGSANIAINESDYNIFFSEAILDNVDKTNIVIDESRQVINYDTNELTLVGEKSILEYEVTNNSKQYDATVKINCMVSDERILEYIDLKYSIDKEIIPAGSKANGVITVELTKAIIDSSEFNKELTCKIDTSAQERTSLSEEEFQPRTYYTYGFLVDEKNEPINDAIVVVYAEETKYALTDDRGMFIVSDLSSGEYDLYVVENMTLEEVQTKTKEEVYDVASQKTSFHTKAASLTFENNYLKYGRVIAGEPITHDLTFDTNGGSTESFTSKVIEGQAIGYLPIIDNNSLVFSNWTENGDEITEETVVNENTTLLANYSEGVAKIGEKNFKTVNLAFDYVSSTEETTIEVISDNSLTAPIINDKNIILNLNGKTVNFKDYNLTNSGDLTITNGNINASGLNVLTNNGNLYLTNKINIEHVNNINESEYISTISNNPSSYLTMDNTYIVTDFSGYVQDQASIRNDGISVINNSTINMQNAVLLDLANANMTINNSNISLASNLENDRMIQCRGTLTINDGNYTLSENNETSIGILNVSAGATLNINSGTFDNTNGTENAIYTSEDSILNIGGINREVNFIGNGTNYYIISSYGDVNINDGTVNATNAPFIGSFRKIIIGSETTIPKINVDNLFLAIREGVENIIYNVNLIQSNSTSTNRAINVYGELTINDGNYRIGEDNQTSGGLMNIQSTGKVIINSGTFDNTNGISTAIYTYAGSTLNIGNKNKEVNFIGNGSNYYTILSYGDLNINNGTINATNGYFLGLLGKIIIGSEDNIPEINVRDGLFLDIRAGAENIIHNVNLTQSNSTSTNRAINVYGELTINDGVYRIGEDNQTSYGLMNIQSTGKVIVNSGTFDNTNGKGNAIYTYAGSTLNIGSKNKEVNFIGNKSTSYTILSYSDVNINDGTVNAMNGHFLGTYGKLVIGTETTIPTINGPTGYKTLVYRSGTEHKIINANISGYNNYVIDVQDATSKLTIDNINLTQSNSTLTNRAINVYGELIINDGIYRIGEDNQTGGGLMNIQSTGKAIIKSGTFDNTNGPSNAIYAYAGSILNIGKNTKVVNFIGNGTNYYIITSYGDVNINDGTVNATNGHFLGIYGKLVIGTETTIPTINGPTGYETLVYRSGTEHKIINANIKGDNNFVIDVQDATSKLTIDNINLTQSNSTSTNRAINVYGELTINNGNISSMADDNKSYGLFNIRSKGILNINGGMYEYNGLNNLMYIFEEGTVNIGKNEQNSIEIKSIYDKSHPLIANHGYLNIYSGIIKTNAANLIVQRKTDDEEEETLLPEEERINYPATTNIYGGTLENNSSKATIGIESGRLEMSGGEVINNGTGRTIYNTGGTAIQTGGISLNNFGVTVE